MRNSSQGSNSDEGSSPNLFEIMKNPENITNLYCEEVKNSPKNSFILSNFKKQYSSLLRVRYIK